MLTSDCLTKLPCLFAFINIERPCSSNTGRVILTYLAERIALMGCRTGRTFVSCFGTYVPIIRSLRPDPDKSLGLADSPDVDYYR